MNTIGSTRRRLREMRGYSLRCEWMLLAIVALRLLPAFPISLAYGALAVFALISRTQAILALVVSWFFTMVNPALVGEAGIRGGGDAGRYIVLLAACVSVAIHGLRERPGRVGGFLILTAVLTIFLIGHSLLLSPLADVSVLKATSWGVATMASVSAWTGLTGLQRTEVAHKVYWCLALVALASLPVLLLPQGYLRNGIGFQGVLNHPQAFGVTMAIFVAWAVARLIESRRPEWVHIMLVALGVTMVLLFHARTAGLAVLAGLGVAVVLTAVLGGHRWRLAAPGFSSPRLWSLLGLCGLASLGLIDRLWGLVQRYLGKGHSSDRSLLDLYDASRGALIDAMLYNISVDPWRGIGFGIASIPSLMTIDRDPVLGLPTGASVEKGIAPLAVLEEVGVLGFVLVMVWMAWLIRDAVRGGLATTALFATIVALNFGESTLFSVGGQGLLGIVLIGWISASGHRRNG